MVLGLWALATMHCDLERAPGFTFLAWCHSPEAAPQQGTDCGGDACSEVESALYKAERQGVTVPTPTLTVSFLPPLLDVTSVTSVPESGLLNPSPPELPRLWQFLYRAALSPRAPSSIA